MYEEHVATGISPADRQWFAPLYATLMEGLGGVARSNGATLLAHCESHSVLWTEDDIRNLMGATHPELVSLCIDAAHVALAGGDPARVVREHAPRVLEAHWKDAITPFEDDFAAAPGETVHDAHRGYMRVVGDGVINWPVFATAMQRTPASAVRIIEVDSAADPLGSIKRSMDVLNDI